MSWDLVKSCTVAITNSAGKVCGTGVFISPVGHLMTCAHVVEAVGGWQQVRVNGQPVTLVHSGDQTRDDFAILQVAGYQGKAAPLTVTFQPMDRFLTIGYGRPDFPQGASIDGAITDINPQADFGNLPMLRLRTQANSQQVQGGYSGSPVYDAENRCVIGLIVAYDNTEGALAIPMSTVLEKWPDLGNFLQSRQIITSAAQPATGRSKVFISYRSQDPDLSLAQSFYEEIKAVGHKPFMAGESIRIGEDWSQRIDQELNECDYFLLLLSPHSAVSEMVTEEARRARHLRDSRAERRPIILPVRVNFPFDAPINYDLAGYLNRIQQRLWESPSDTPAILHEILQLIAERQDTTSEPESPKDGDLPPVIGAGIRVEVDQPPLPAAEPELPGGQVDLASKFYVERPPLEANCYNMIEQFGALIRIKAPRQMGKTSLMARTLRHAQQQGYEIVPLSLQLTDSRVVRDLDSLLQWLCATTSRRLKLPIRIKEEWDEIFGSVSNCTNYMEQFILSQLNSPLVLAIDEVDRVFDNPDVTVNFFAMLRAWHERGKDGSTTNVWRQFRQIIVHSTEVYIPLHVNQSPFNVGMGVELPEFNSDQVRDLAQRNGLPWSVTEVSRLINLVGGHPYLTQVALYHVARKEMTLEDLECDGPTEGGVFGDHLRRHLWNLEQHPTLRDAVARILTNKQPVRLDTESTFLLESMGLVRMRGNDVSLRYALYDRYFRDRLTVR